MEVETFGSSHYNQLSVMRNLGLFNTSYPMHGRGMIVNRPCVYSNKETVTRFLNATTQNHTTHLLCGPSGVDCILRNKKNVYL